VTALIIGLLVLHAIVLHELAHGCVACALGDTTAKDAGRLSLNPLRHVDPIGSVVVPVLGWLLFGAPGGWAKSVPVDVMRLRNKGRSMFYVAAAGPAASAACALVWWVGYLLLRGDIALYGAIVNAALGLVNMLPIPPLDGGRMLVARLPYWIGARYERIAERWGLPLAICIVALVVWSVRGTT
jgi:Zn-dependent protease